MDESKIQEARKAARNALDTGSTLEEIRENMEKAGYSQEEINKILAPIDWKSERKEYKESGKQAKDESKLQARSDKLMLKRIGVIAACILVVFIFGIGLMSAALLVAFIITYSTIGERGIH